VKVRIAIRIAAAMVAGAAIVTVVTGTLRRWPWVNLSWSWLDSFVRTPGFGAIAALVAAVIAYRAATLRIRHDQQTDADRRAAEETSADAGRRWEMLMWVYEHLDTVDPARILTVCRALALEMKTPLERSMLAAMMKDRLDEDEEVR
jgi:hypothetical protein